MSNMWTEIKAKALGFPEFPVEACPTLEGNAIAWLPGMKTSGLADWYFVVWHTGDLRRYREDGGDPDKLVMHHLTYDVGAIDPLWGRESFHKRAERMKEFGVKYVVAPDFSSWADYPVAVQLHNYYKSMVVACDLVKAGFSVIPLVCWSAPQIAALSISAWPKDMPCAVVDGAHLKTVDNDFNSSVFWGGAESYKSLNVKKTFVWANSQNVAARWQWLTGSECVYVPTRTRSLNQLSKFKRSKNVQHANTQ